MKYLAIREWDDGEPDELLGTFDTREEADRVIESDFNTYGSKIFVREHVSYRVDEEA